MFERVGLGHVDDVASERGQCLAFFRICDVMEVVVGLMADDSPLQSRSGAEPRFGAKLSFGLRLAGSARLGGALVVLLPYRDRRMAHALQRIAILGGVLQFSAARVRYGIRRQKGETSAKNPEPQHPTGRRCRPARAWS
jgi:hypothetical protein